MIRDEFGNSVASVSQYLGIRTNNFAEYEAVILALDTLAKLLKGKTNGVDITVEMDSELVVKQMKGEYKVKHPTMRVQYDRLVEAGKSFKKVSFTHVFREENSDADALANEAMDRGA